MSTSSAAPLSAIPPSIILPQRRYTRISAVDGPWLHAGVASGEMHPDVLGRDLAAFLDVTDDAVIQVLVQFFSKVKEFDEQAFNYARQTLTELPAKHAFALMGFPPEGPLPQKVPGNVVGGSARLDCATGKPARPVVASPSPVLQLVPGRVPQDIGVMSDWCAMLKRARDKFKENPAMFTLAAPDGAPQASPTVRLVEDAHKTAAAMAHLNLHSFVHSLKLFIFHDPKMSNETVRTIVTKEAEEHSFQFTPEQLDAAIRKTNIAKLATPLLYAFNYHPSAILNSFKILGLPPHQQLSIWKDKGNLHYNNPQHPLVIVTKIFMRLALRAALNLTSTDSVPSDFFEHPEVLAALDLKADDDSRHALTLPAVPLTITDEPHPIFYVDDEGESVEVSAVRTVAEKSSTELPKPKPKGGPKPKKERDPTLDSTRVTRSKAKGGDTSSSEQTGQKRKAQSQPDDADVSTKKSKSASGRSVPASRRKLSKGKAATPNSAEDPTDDESETSSVEDDHVTWLTLTDDFDAPDIRECEDLHARFQDVTTHLDPLLVYPKAGATDEVHIDYYTFSHEDRNEDGTLRATMHSTGYRWTPFKRNLTSGKKQQAAEMRLIVQSQPTIRVNNVDVPLHVDRSAQAFHSSGDRTQIDAGVLSDIRAGHTQSMIYVTAVEQWRQLNGRQRHELLRHRGALIVHPTPPLAPDGERWGFDVATMSVFTDPHRLANIHDLGACLHKDVPPKKVGRPSDMITCAERRQGLESESEARLFGQSLNLLSNPLEGISTVFPAGWRDIATHEIAMQWLREKAELPQLPPMIQEFNWAIFATANAVTWHHHDVLFTMVGTITGEKLWFVGRRKDLPAHDLRGLLHSRHAYDRFNGWTHMTNVWEFECIHLDDRTTFYMQASVIHAVISKTDCIASGRHAIPMSNVSECVLTTLHNVMLSSILTNADHEPARRVLLRMFALFALAIIDPQHRNSVATDETDDEPRAGKNAQLSSRSNPILRTHTPEITSPQGIVDLLAVRSFTILFMPLSSALYNFIQDDVLPFDRVLFKEIRYLWSLANELDTCIAQRYTIRNTNGSDVLPTSFAEAADEHLTTMAASLIRYQEVTFKREDIRKARPENFTPIAFSFQMLQAVARFDLHRQWHAFNSVADGTPGTTEPLFSQNQWMTEDDMASLPLCAALTAKLDDRRDDCAFLMKWTADTLPFMLQTK
ncbi:hypothetical protein B0H12DRAFT_1079171 [Mycena haematopus]|nr:hypothetical protein B0H12DRAFT_1079171 [Mycena haematopus]